jgi:hypothetical protein
MTERDIELVEECIDRYFIRDVGFFENFNKEKFADLIRADEREACARIVETEAMQYAEPTWAFEIVNDIRARGNT